MHFSVTKDVIILPPIYGLLVIVLLLFSWMIFVDIYFFRVLHISQIIILSRILPPPIL